MSCYAVGMVREDPDTIELLKPIRLRGHSVKPWPMPPTVDEVYSLTLRCWAHDPSAPRVHTPDTYISPETISDVKARLSARPRVARHRARKAAQQRQERRSVCERYYTPPPPVLTLSDRVNAMSRDEIRDWLLVLAAERIMGVI